MKRRIDEILRVLRAVRDFGPGSQAPMYEHAVDPSGVYHAEILAQSNMIKVAHAAHAVIAYELSWPGQDLLDSLSHGLDQAQDHAEVMTGDRDNLPAVLAYLKEQQHGF